MNMIAGKAVTLLFIMIIPNYGYGLDEEYKNAVQNFINTVNNKEELVMLIRFPLRREYPLPSINNEKEFIQRFEEVFDRRLIETISTSDINNDWSNVGWRGIMLKNGLLWLNQDGKVIGINYQSEIEKIKIADLIRIEKRQLHNSIQEYIAPVFEWKTKKYRIRVDRLGDDKYRYAAWTSNKSSSEKPDIILENGELIYEGSGGNHHFDFISGAYKYICDVIVIGSNQSPPGVLNVYKNDDLILEDPVIEVINKR